ncbi:amine oxidase [copper-containing] gamma 2-like isoform X1 [Phragmites australis]|uniref:amine oxidase [copper-containing] gamma 2-like isoform X1 n=1 Tax=Phragmites australis TaxID=29695 RepID=UPI002D78D12A|nr:amine oxidase [copper-containing] gamma 2-like isoform X1 [Phragmites australis]
MDHSTSLLRLIFLALGAALVLLLVRSAFRLPRGIDTPTASLFDDAGGSSCTRFTPWACRTGRRADQKPKPASHEDDVPLHPLDPLTVAEVNRARELLRAHPPFASSPSSLFVHSVALDEPDKPVVLRWRKGTDPLPPRRAVAVVRFCGEAYVLAVDLAGGAVAPLPVPASGYPTMTMDEQVSLCWAPFSDPAFNATIRRRGVRMSDLACLPISLGWYGPTEENRRLIKIQCFSAEGTANFYMRPIEGLTVLLDMDTKEVIQISDRGAGIPIPAAANTDYRHARHAKDGDLTSTRGLGFQNVRAPSMEPAPSGPGFELVDGHTVRWGGWEFHLKADARAGMVVSRARVQDPSTGAHREVMYKGMASELFVPYMDPTEAWYFKTYMDAGEYGFGLQAMPLVPLNDCPRHARYVDGVFVAADGRPYVRENMICVFERYAGDIAWRHSESPITGMDIRESRPKVTLVARMAASVANYDYIMDWEFQMDGLVRIKVGLSGILMVKGTPYSHMNQVRQNEDMHGTLLSENVIGVIHDHYVTFRLDMDVDGADNSFVRVEMARQETAPGESPRRSYIKATRHVAQTEKDAQIRLKLYEPAEFHVVNPTKKTRVGNPVGYKVVPAGTAASVLDPEDPPQKRGAFTNNQIWVTPYNKSEEWAGGLFVYQSKGEDTLATWSDRDRPIENKDLVLWYTLGFHHIPCQEDFPIMPTVSSSFDLKPVNFFGSNPILKQRPTEENHLPVCAAPAA